MRLRLRALSATLAVARLESDAPLPSWINGSFTSITRTTEELSIVCDEAAVPHDVRAERGWRGLALAGPIAFETTGVAAALVAPLASAGISVFLIATFDTDYLLVKQERFVETLAVLRSAGHDIA